MLFENIYKEKFGDGAFLDIDLVQQSGLGVKCTSNSKGEDVKVVFKLIYTNHSRYFRKIHKKIEINDFLAGLEQFFTGVLTHRPPHRRFCRCAGSRP